MTVVISSIQHPQFAPNFVQRVGASNVTFAKGVCKMGKSPNTEMPSTETGAFASCDGP